MKFQFHSDESLPKLSWCLKIERNNQVVNCVHGDWVETETSFFVEGGWAEDYAAGKLRESQTLMGSGAVVNDGSITLCTPCHVLECLYSLQRENSLLFSNSLAFLLATAGDNLDPRYLDYEGDILSIVEGLQKYKRFIPTEGGKNVQLHYYCNIKVDSDLRIAILDKHHSPGFAGFDAYYRYLVESTVGIAANLTDSRRKKQYQPIVFCSAGYDSSACAVIGRTVGCDEAVVFESRKGVRSDSGINIVESLGYTVIHEKHESDYLKYDIVEDFVSSGELGTAIFYGAAQAELEGKYLLAGDFGDGVWAKTDPTRNLEFARPMGLPSSAMKEFRLRVGFIKVAVPFFGADKTYDILRISNSEEMQPWVVGGDYDKPIPRRIVEAAGIPRGRFAVRKDGGVGNSLRFLGLKHLRKVMPPGSYCDFEKYYAEHKQFRPMSPKFIQRSLRYCCFLAVTCLGKMMLKSNICLIHTYRILPKNWHRDSCSPWAPSLLFNWGVTKVMKRYANVGKKFETLFAGGSRTDPPG